MLLPFEIHLQNGFLKNGAVFVVLVKRASGANEKIVFDTIIGPYVHIHSCLVNKMSHIDCLFSFRVINL